MRVTWKHGIVVYCHTKERRLSDIEDIKNEIEMMWNTGRVHKKHSSLQGQQASSIKRPQYKTYTYTGYDFEDVCNKKKY